MSFLLIDAGNTRIKFGCHDGARWLHHEAVDEVHAIVLPSGFAPHRIVISNVAGEGIAAALRAHLQGWHCAPVFFHSSHSCTGLRNDYASPQQLGSDRWASAVAAWRRLRAACLVISAGTATTLDVISADGVFAGGCILPGLTMMNAALRGGTAQLRSASGNYALIPRNTDDAIFSGCLNAQLGAVARMHAQLPQGSQLVVTGGAAQALLPHLSAYEVVHEPWLVLQGLLDATRGDE